MALDVDALAMARAAYDKAVRFEECRPQGLQHRLAKQRGWSGCASRTERP
jgi:hypothetical protein